MHADTLRELAAKAQALTSDGALEQARDAWRESLELLPEGSQQHAVIRTKVAELETRLAERGAPATATRRAAADGKLWWGQGASQSN